MAKIGLKCQDCPEVRTCSVPVRNREKSEKCKRIKLVSKQEKNWNRGYQTFKEEKYGQKQD